MSAPSAQTLQRLASETGLQAGTLEKLDNPLLREPLTAEHIKPRLLGHWGTTPGLNLIYAHLNRQIRDRELNAIESIQRVSVPGAHRHAEAAPLHHRRRRGPVPNRTRGSTSGRRLDADQGHHLRRRQRWLTSSRNR